MYSILLGNNILFSGNDYSQEVDPELLAYCYVNFARLPQAFYPFVFKALADGVLSVLQLSQYDITPDNFKQVNVYLAFVLSNVIPA